jgi:beta-glucanase (GH16 family)
MDRIESGLTPKLLVSTRMLLTLLLVSATSAAPRTKWTLTWSDEFNGPKNSVPDQAKWAYDLGAGGWGNHELEEYSDKKENVFLDGRGHLAIRAVRLESGRITSGRLKTQGRFEVQYGRIEARIKIPYGQGIWPAFWMLGKTFSTAGWPRCGEIDIMENIGKEASTIHGTVHGPGYSGAEGVTAQVSLEGHSRFTGRFHVFAAEWSPDVIVFSLDGRSYARVRRDSLRVGAPWVFDQPFFLLLNLAIGGDWPGNPDSTTQFPQTMLVDWVRVWTRTGDVPPTTGRAAREISISTTKRN